MRGRGLVIGAGGVVGMAWIATALRRLEQQEGWDPREADAIVGTSAGSIVATLLASGFSTADILGLQRTGRLPGVVWQRGRSSGPLPPPPVPLPSSPALAASLLLPWRRVTPTAAAVGLLPRGREAMPGVRRLIEAVVPDGGWVDHPRTWLVAMDLSSGRRVAFGRPGSPAAGQVDAVLASCAIPGWFQPVRIDGRDHVDGGVRSVTSADLLAREGLDEVVIVSPMTSASRHPAASLGEHAERLVRHAASRRLAREVRRLEAAGTRVRRIEPTAAELAVMGPNLMDPRRRGPVLDEWDEQVA